MRGLSSLFLCDLFAKFVEFLFETLCVGASPQLALLVEIGTQFLSVGAPDFIFNKFVACVFLFCLLLSI